MLGACCRSTRADKHPQMLTEQHQLLYNTDLYCFSCARSLGNILCWDQPLLVLTRMETLQCHSIVGEEKRWAVVL